MTPAGPAACIVAVAGRRVDLPGASPERFPLRNRNRVRAGIASSLSARPVSLVIASAACGADLLALDAAAELGIRQRIILPGSVEHFRAHSVTDRPGDWGPLFDRLTAEAERRGDLVVLNGDPGDDAYVRTNMAVLDEGDARADEAGAARMALIAWDGESRGADDLTDQFRTEAIRRIWLVDEIRTR